ncbi:pitrilysin family protein [uncultured Ilyobacter sp.]|uniref:M16 family metallopeptidase n=1 Tax=uncultured Ilyobacter sp. TaxID=544433 RepID=UPI0029C0A068|nr:pitrilysin family protein [uncultured Ilyobacter sp.]
MKIEILKLKNGIPVLIENIENLNSVALGIFVKTGAKNELPGEEGVSHLLEHMMFKGTTNRSSKEISEMVDNEGGIINAYTSKEMTVYYIQLLSHKLKVGTDILTDIFLNSTFTEESLEKEKNVVIEEIKMYEDIPEEKVHDENVRFAVSGSQSNIVLGSMESVKNITREKLVSYFEERYVPSKMVISVAGRVDKDEIMNLLNQGIGTLERDEFEREYDGKMSINSGENIIKRDTNQMHLCFNTKGVSTTDKIRYSVSIISNILGGNMSSRLFQKIREERGLAYSVYSYNSSFEEGGLFTVYAGTTKENYRDVIDMIKNEFEEIKKDGITEEELRKAKNQFLSMLTFGLETSKSRMNRMASSYLIYNRVRDLDEIIKEIEEISLEDIKNAATKIFDEKYYSWTILGDL